MNRHTLFAAALPALVVFMAAAGCEVKLTDERYAQLKAGMTDSEVEGILRCGKGTDETVGGVSMSGSGLSQRGGTDSVWLYKDGDRSVTVTYRDGKAISFNKRGF